MQSMLVVHHAHLLSTQNLHVRSFLCIFFQVFMSCHNLFLFE